MNGALFCALALTLLTDVLPSVPELRAERVAHVLPKLMLLLAPNFAMLLFGVAGGWLLRRRNPWGRWLATIAAALGVALFFHLAVSIPLAVVSLWLLHRRRSRALFQPAYRALVAATPSTVAEGWPARAAYACTLALLSGLQFVYFLAGIASHTR